MLIDAIIVYFINKSIINWDFNNLLYIDQNWRTSHELDALMFIIKMILMWNISPKHKDQQYSLCYS